MSKKQSFAPVVNHNTKLLVLGSLPGEKSLAQNQYYGNSQNRFWMLMSEALGVELVALTYPMRLQTWLNNGVGLWDVVAQAHREGSLDSNIRNQTNNDLISLFATLPQLATIAFNGGTAARIGLKVLGQYAERYRIIQLPSSSPAYTLTYEKKLAAWRVLRDQLNTTSR